MKLTKTKAKAVFKRQCGQTNHFLITLLIGCEAAKDLDNPPPYYLNAAWNPQDASQSIARARDFALRATLAWTIDCLDSYTYLIARKPYNYLDYLSAPKSLNANHGPNDGHIVNSLKFELDGAGHSVSKRVECLARYFEIDDRLNALVRLAIIWRNSIIHSATRHHTQKELLEIRTPLLQNAIYYEQHFCHLDVHRAIEDITQAHELSLKEVTSFVRAVRFFVDQVDEALIAKVNLNSYASSALCELAIPSASTLKKIFDTSGDDTDNLTPANREGTSLPYPPAENHRRFRQKIQSLNGIRLENYVANVLQNSFGITDANSNELNSLIEHVRNHIKDSLNNA